MSGHSVSTGPAGPDHPHAHFRENAFKGLYITPIRYRGCPRTFALTFVGIKREPDFGDEFLTHIETLRQRCADCLCLSVPSPTFQARMAFMREAGGYRFQCQEKPAKREGIT